MTFLLLFSFLHTERHPAQTPQAQIFPGYPYYLHSRGRPMHMLTLVPWFIPSLKRGSTCSRAASFNQFGHSCDVTIYH
ncbi:uncharacterized protein BO96DRAFT_197136 [Aspergillus niger CBS 101883]|uniref:uncharacterized protein n=1 Tax=Aspergillus lacticoffeatus (strain CBS 101883) TaxID=1450533 RepID=UPI000D7F7D0E|nr:uncharacterized protein BO96DRAFT_197136 [Aspergillus niger CBS 101883]PYH51105.1 hypothetical protein BO96DRAFT_197136 [Aspergillus niger CBS 101883]